MPSPRPDAARSVPTTREEVLRRVHLRWPRLDRRGLARCQGDVACISRHVARRTNLPPETIRAIVDPVLNEAEAAIWFG